MGNENDCRELHPSSSSSSSGDDAEENRVEETGKAAAKVDKVGDNNDDDEEEEKESSSDQCAETKPSKNKAEVKEKPREEEDMSTEQQLIQEISRLTIQEEKEKEAAVPPGLRALASWIRDGACTRILVLSGAGVSVAAG
jgi:hypothetical protein